MALDVELIPVLNDNYCYLLHDTEQGITGVVDPPVASVILERLKARGLKLDWILTTHHHQDHTAGNLELKEATGCKIVGPRAEASKIPGIDQSVSEGDTFALGGSQAQVFDTPGHTAGHITFWFPEGKALFCADVLFSLGCGRLFEGTPDQMWSSMEKFSSMPDETLVYCGHEYTASNARFALSIDPDNEALKRRAAEIEEQRAAGKPTIPSTLGEERAANPFLRVEDEGLRASLNLSDATPGEVFGEIRRRKDNF